MWPSLVFPTAVGAGKRLFDAASIPASFAMEASETTRAGATALTLRRVEFRAGNLAVEEGKEAVI